MNLRRRSKAGSLEVNEGASTSSEYSPDRVVEANSRTPKTCTAPEVAVNEQYLFPERLVKDRRWRETALSNKVDKEAAGIIHLSMVFDFFNKFSDAFGLTKLTEEQIEDAAASERSSNGAATLINMIVELLKGCTSVDNSNQVRMFQRNRIYRETSESNFNKSLWEFFEHDWKQLSSEKAEVRNVLGQSKDEADFFVLPCRIRAALLSDICSYRLMCPDAQNIIDSVTDESVVPMGDQLRTFPIGHADDSDFYYLGGSRVYRLKVLSKKEIAKRRSEYFGSQELPKVLKEGSSVSDERKDDPPKQPTVDENSNSSASPVGGNSALLKLEEYETNGKTDVQSGTEGAVREIATAQRSDEKDGTPAVKEEECYSNGVKTAETSGDGSQTQRGAEVEHVALLNGIVPCEQEYFKNLIDFNNKWEVVCASEDDVHFLIELCRTSRSAEQKALADRLINTVLPSVRKVIRDRIIAEKNAERRSRFLPRETTGSPFGGTELRHSARLESKKIEREKQLEEKKRLDIEQENMIREREGRRKIQSSVTPPAEQQKLTREDRMRLREQRIEEQNIAKRLKLEVADAACLENQEKSDISEISSLSSAQQRSTTSTPCCGSEADLAAESKEVKDALQPAEANGAELSVGNNTGTVLPSQNSESDKVIEHNSAPEQVSCLSKTISFPGSTGQMGTSAVHCDYAAQSSAPAVTASRSRRKQQFHEVRKEFPASWPERSMFQAGTSYNPNSYSRQNSRAFPEQSRAQATRFVPVNSVMKRRYLSPDRMVAGSGRSFSYLSDLCSSGNYATINSSGNANILETQRPAEESGNVSGNQGVDDSDFLMEASSSGRQAARGSPKWQRIDMTHGWRIARPGIEYQPLPSADYLIDDSCGQPVEVDEDTGHESPPPREYVEFPFRNDFFRILIPPDARLTLLASGPLHDHDYIVPSVELIMDQKWTFVTDPVDSTSTFMRTEFNLQFEGAEEGSDEDDLVDVDGSTVVEEGQDSFCQELYGGTSGQQLYGDASGEHEVMDIGSDGLL